MSKSLSTLLLLCGAGLLAFLVWWVMADPTLPTRHPSRSTPPQQEGFEKPDLATTESAAPHAPQSGAQERIEVEVTDDKDGTHVSPLLAHAEGPDAVLVSLVDAESGDPVPDCDLFVLRLEDENLQVLERALRNGTTEINALVAERGNHYRSDRLGQVRIPPVREDPLLLAQSPGYFGMRWNFELGQKEWVLELEREQQLEVRVVNDQGEPQPGVRLSLVLDNKSFRYEVRKAQCDDQGTTTLRGLNSYLRSAEQLRGSLVITFGFPIAEELLQDQRIWCPLDEEVLSVGAVELVLPETGSLRVRLHRSDGSPLTEKTLVSLASVGESEANHGWINQSSWRGEKGEILIPHIGLGLELAGSVHIEGRGFGDDVRWPGPQQAGQVVDVDWIDPALAVLTGRILDPAGEPLVSSDCTVFTTIHQTNGSHSRGTQLKTDGEGRFRYLLQEAAMPNGAEGWTMRIESRREDGVIAVHQINLAPAYALGETDLGDLLLTEAEILAAGQVVDSEGNPVPHCWLSLSRMVRDEHSEYWTSLDQGGNAQVAADGSFVIQGACEVTNLKLEAHAPGYLVTTTPLLRGQRDLRIELTSSPTLIAEVLVDENIRPQDLMVHAESEDHGHSGLSFEGGHGRLKVSSSLPWSGPFNLSIRTHANEEVHRSENLLAVPGQNLLPPELNPLDLRGKLHRLSLKVVDSSGNPLVARARLKEKQGAQILQSNRGWIEGVVLDLPVPAEVQAAGYRPAEIELTGTDQQVQLRPGIPIRLQWSNPVPLPQGFSLSMRTRNQSFGGGYLIGQNRESLGSDGSIDQVINEPGTHRIMILLTRTDGSSSHSSLINNGHEIDVRDQSALQTFHIALDPADLDQAISAMQDRD